MLDYVEYFSYNGKGNMRKNDCIGGWLSVDT